MGIWLLLPVSTIQSPNTTTAGALGVTACAMLLIVVSSSTSSAAASAPERQVGAIGSVCVSVSVSVCDAADGERVVF